jgi:hypothetical protein
MKLFPKMSFKYLAAIGTAVMAVSAAYASSFADCQPICSNYAQQAYNASKPSYATQQTNYCNSLTDPSAKSACLAGVPAFAEQQAQATYNNVYNQCMSSCTRF